jgi:RNA polymerase sigma-70 factor (ECF subfamily)
VDTLALIVESDARILEEYRTGSRELAATAFVRRHQRFVMSVALRHLNHVEDAQDAAQEAFIRALQSLESFKAESSVQTWLYRITVNVCASMRRKKKLTRLFAFGEAETEIDAPSHEPNPEQVTIESDRQRQLLRALEQVPPKQRETFCLRYFDELSYEEISAMLGTSVGALKANYHHAVKKLAAILRDEL